MANVGLGAWPARRAAISPGRTALVFQGDRITYAELHMRVGHAAARLRAAGVGPGDRVAYLGPNHPAFVETMFATHRLGAVFVPLNFRLTAPEIDYMLLHSGTSVLVYGPSCAETVQSLSTAVVLMPLSAMAGDSGPSVDESVATSPSASTMGGGPSADEDVAAPAGDGGPAVDDGVATPLGASAGDGGPSVDEGVAVSLAGSARGGPSVDEAVATSPGVSAVGDGAPVEDGVAMSLDDAAFILYTSGTTGRPKGAVLTHGNVVWNCFNLLVGVDVGGDEVGLIGAPLFHVAALNQCLLPTFLKGGASVIMPRWEVDEALTLIASQRVTWMFGVSAMFAALARSPRWVSTDLSSVRSVMSGGAAVPPALITAYQERGLTFCQGYGLTETAPGATFLEARESSAHVGSAGVPVFFADVRCVRPDLSDTEAGEPGEVWVRGANVTPGYWNDPAATAAAFADGGWFRSGDVAVVDDEGHFHIVDRLTDMYVSGGENVYPAEVEAVLFEHPAVAEAAVVGVPDEKWGEVGRAFVVAAPGREVDPAEVREFLGGRLARYKLPAYFDVVEDLPRTGSNKVRKAPLRARPLNTGTPRER
ncbi:acyl-CoA synthetase [Paractinoplanes hotanensis]|uniref:Long-chain fatty acid--CoA ligase n=1 Tax=Paractinoplanes hotanensis TaxID=2906497 RepID=A0ABT0Y051_9ACTN|nr:long-chain fatty acid--CoA ligase [Actinoplanes hotanensis]MCM4078709.1 long-chain fatty acid--CoA ligase [Actinoplanes hotanensis]